MGSLPSTAASQIRFLLQSLNDSNFDSVFRELTEIADLESEDSILLLQTLLDQVNFRDGDVQLKLDVLSAIFRHLMGRPNFTTVLCVALRNTQMSEGFLNGLSNALNLTTPEKIGVGLALSESENLDFRMKGQNFCMTYIEELCDNPAVMTSNEQIQDIFIFLSRSQGLAKFVDSFTKMLSLLQLKEGTPCVLSPMLPNDFFEVNSMRHLDLLFESKENDFDVLLQEIEAEISMADIVKELGYGCTVNSSQCKQILSLLSPLNEVTISRIVSTVVRTHTGLEDGQNTYSTFCSALGWGSATESSLLNSWSLDVLADSIKQLAPETNWVSVIENLDHEGFYLPDEGAFSLLMSIYKSVTQDPFPLHAVCGSVWKNAEGQLSFLRYAISAPPEIFSFAHSARKLSYIDSQQGSKLPNGHENQAWLCLDLIEVLCQLAERGHANSVRAILEIPLKQCPDLLLICLAHINTSFNLLQREVTSVVFPMLIGNSMRGAILQNLWSVNPYLVVHSFVDMQNVDSDNLSKVLDICQELKILPSVLDMAPFAFSIKLVAFAAKKDQINLEKWLNENLTAYKDPFFEACVKFMKEMSFYASNEGSANSIQQTGAPINAYAELMSTFLKVLQAYSGQLISHQLAEELNRLQITHVTPRLLSTGTAESTTSDGFPDDVEAEANSYFHQMFSGQLSVDAMVQMLSRFQDSPEKREQSIFECIIGNIFEEYRFYPKYPEKQLRITAVLFGSVIKHRLVGHLTLGMALRYVLDALRKSVDSKMFVFGAKALEQFVDRLVEWPQYCNHILQISHLRGTHAELVAFIERALARISSGQSDSNGVNNGPSDQHQGLNSHENMEVSDASWQTIGVGTVQSGQQFSHQLQQRQQGFLDDKQKPSATSVGYSKHPITALPGSVGSAPSDATNSQKTSPSFQAVSTQSPPSVPPVTPFPRPSRALPPTGVLRPHTSNTGFGAALNIETLVAAAERRDTLIEAPSSEIQDKVSFIINNISGSNMEAKAKEFNEILKEQYYPWFAQYMVMKRASIEPNFHELYLKFVDKVNSKDLNKEIVKTTYENCKVLLRSELIKSSSEERSLLKNLGSWLGKFTIGRNQALRAREIDPKVLIIEAYEKGLMIAVIPFTSKILEPCQSSLAYQPPNPWTMGILGLLAEIYALPNLKMNLKFDIEVLFKNLGVDMKDVKPSSLLKDRVREIEGNPDFSTKDATQPQMLTEVDSQKDPTLPYNPAPLPFPSSPAGETTTGPGNIVNPVHPLPQPSPNPLPFPVPQLPSPILNIGTQVIINPKLSGHLKFPLQRVVSAAMERAVREIMSPVVDRSVTIAMRTTKELVLKDYAMESDESRIFNSAHLMVASLAGSLAHVTCKEPLRAAITNHLKSLLQTLSVSADILEQAVQLVTNDNLDLGCALIEQAATEKALQSIDGEIAPQLMLRRKHRDTVGSQYFDATTYSQGPFARVPEALRPKPGRLSIAQQRVYEDFVRIPWQNQPSPSSNAPQSGQGNSNYYPAVQVAPGVVQPLDLPPEEDPGSTQLLSTSPNRIGITDDPKSSVPSFPATVISTEPHSLDSGAAEKEAGTLNQLSPAYSGDRSGSVLEQLLSTGDALDKYQMVAQKLEVLITKDARDADIQGVIAEVPDILLRCVSRDEAALAVAQKVFKSLYENASNNTHVTSHLAILAAIRDVCKLVVKELTSWVIYSDEERKFNKDITIGLIRTELVNLAEYNVHLAKLIDGGRNKAATDFAISLVHTLVYQETGVSVSEFYSLVDALEKLASRPGVPESLQQLVEIARNSPANQVPFPRFVIGKDDKARPSRDKKLPTSRSMASREDYSMTEPSTADPTGFREQVTLLFREWYRICELPGAVDAACSHYISQLQQSGLLKGDDITDRFFRILMELSVGHCLASEVINPNPMTLQNPQHGQHLSFMAIDMFTKLVVLILKCWAVEQGSSKLGLLPKILVVIVRVVQKDAEEKKASFNPRPYFRFFVNCLLDLVSPDPAFEGATLQILTTFANAFHVLQPLRVPGFSFAWLELVSHRSFMPKLLTSPSQKGWPFVQRLLVDLFKFMEPYLRNAELGDAVQFLYKGTLRVLLVLLHDFPEFLCDYHFSFCDVIPPSCIQMRNVILSAFPRNMRLPDPSTPNLKIDLLAEIKQSPQILSEVDAALKAKQMKADIDEYLKTKQGALLPSDLKQKLLLPQGEVAFAGTRYNVPLINSLVLYVGMQAIQQLQSKSAQQMSGNMDIFLAGAAMEIFQALIRDLDTEGRYLFLNAVANQLRYPNNHTHYFSFVLLYLFAEAKLEIVQEQITRVLLERLIVNRPHPWGLLITFIELIKNPRYDFWSKSFTRCAPEIEKLFESVSRSCGGAKAVDDGMVSGGI